MNHTSINHLTIRSVLALSLSWMIFFQGSLIAQDKEPQDGGFRLEFANGKVCKLTEYTIPAGVGLKRYQPETGVPIRVRGTIRVAEWGDQTKARGSKPHLLLPGSTKKRFSFKDYVPPDLNPRFEKPEINKGRPANEYLYDTLFYVPEPFTGGTLMFGDLAVPLPELSPDDSISGPDFEPEITSTELIGELKKVYQVDALKYEGAIELTTVKPIVGAIMKVSLVPAMGCEATMEESTVELESGARVRVCGYLYRGTTQLFRPGQTVRPIFVQDQAPTLFFVVPKTTDSFRLHIGGKNVSGTVKPLAKQK